MESITIPKNVTVIGNRAFAYCEALTHVTIMNGSVDIAQTAFFGCGKNLVIRAHSNSSAEKYAADNSLNFERI